MAKKKDKDRPGAIVDRNAEDAAKTARGASRVLINDSLGSAVLSAVAGYVDTAGFLALFGLFTAHVTGDLVTAAVLIARKLDAGGLIRLSMVPVFMLTVALVTLFARAIGRRGALTLAPLLSLMTVLMGLFCLSGHYLREYAASDASWAVALTGGLGVAAMGVQNALMRGPLKSFTQTTVMTGNLTQLTIDFLDWAFPPKAMEKREKKQFRKHAAAQARKSGFPLLAFMAGAAGGAFLTQRYGLLSLAAPTGVLAILSVVAWIRSRRRV
jgi:uncharacterized membrane protein YoaK (UPF0700 family)